MSILDVPLRLFNATDPQLGTVARHLRHVLAGWRLTWTLIIAISVYATRVAALIGGVSGANEGIRITARTSAVLFLLAFTASSAYLGVSFAGSHLVHAAFIVASILLDGHRFRTGVAHTPHAIYALDSVAYVFIVAMTLTSFDRIAKRMRYTAWRSIHLTGSYVIWLTFFVAYWRRGVTYPLFYGPFLMIVLGALVVRAIASAQRKRPRIASTLSEK
jgi:sulfoxide reductase heme-binding subunit YedZ